MLEVFGFCDLAFGTIADKSLLHWFVVRTMLIITNTYYAKSDNNDYCINTDNITLTFDHNIRSKPVLIMCNDYYWLDKHILLLNHGRCLERLLWGYLKDGKLAAPVAVSHENQYNSVLSGTQKKIDQHESSGKYCTTLWNSFIK